MRLVSIVAFGGLASFFCGKKLNGGKGLFLLGVFGKYVCRAWCFGGENVVECVVNVVFWMVSFAERKM
jgi:hypothetical protein